MNPNFKQFLITGLITSCFVISLSLNTQRGMSERNPPGVRPTADTLPISELGLGLWKDHPGGLYPGGSNKRPLAHDTAGIRLGRSILPLDTFGFSNDQSGKIVLLSIGMSNCTQEYSVFKNMADTFRSKNPKVWIVDGAQGGQTASVIKDPNANFWRVVTQRLYQQQTHPLQVQAIWLKEANANPNQAFPKHAEDLRKDLHQIVQVLQQKFPHLKLVYLSSRTYGGYANTPLNPEPYAYETGFSVKWLIDAQIQGDSTLQFRGDRAMAPWLSWGPYLWAAGETPRKDDGLFWLRSDFANDGTHPSNSGRLKVAQLLLRFFTSDSTATPWFLKQNLTYVSNEGTDHPANFNMVLAPNPVRSASTLFWNMPQTEKAIISLTDVTGNFKRMLANDIFQSGAQTLNLESRGIPPGVFSIQIKTQSNSEAIQCVFLERF